MCNLYVFKKKLTVQPTQHEAGTRQTNDEVDVDEQLKYGFEFQSLINNLKN